MNIYLHDLLFIIIIGNWLHFCNYFGIISHCGFRDRSDEFSGFAVCGVCERQGFRN